MTTATKVKLELTVEEVQGVLNALGDQRYNSVAALIDNLRNQVIPQIQPPAPEAKEESVPA
jgi:hypothetical protein